MADCSGTSLLSSSSNSHLHSAISSLQTSLFAPSLPSQDKSSSISSSITGSTSYSCSAVLIFNPVDRPVNVQLDTFMLELLVSTVESAFAIAVSATDIESILLWFSKLSSVRLISLFIDSLVLDISSSWYFALLFTDVDDVK